MLTNSPEKNRRETCFHGVYLALAVMLTIGVPSADATLLVYEGFNYGVGEEIANQNGGTGFSGVWDNFVPALPGSVSSGSLTSGSHPTTGNSGSFDTALLRRSVDEIAGTPGTQTWSSFLFSTSVSTVDPSDYSACVFFSSIEGFEGGFCVGGFAEEGGDGQLYLGFGYEYNKAAALSSIAIVPGETYLLTVSIDWNADAAPETIRLYLNPSSGAAPDSGDAIAIMTNRDIASPWGMGDPSVPPAPNRISNIGAGGYVPGGVVTFDEIRIGTTFADVVPVPEPSTAGLVAIALGAFARSRRVRRA